MECPSNHIVDANANFCPVCGVDLRITKLSTQSTPLDRFQRRTTWVSADSNPFGSLDGGNIRGFGRNHEIMARAVASYVGSTLASADLGRIVTEFDPSFSTGSLLFNDHAEGNAGACRCARTKDRIFERVGRGYYQVRNLNVDGGVAAESAILALDETDNLDSRNDGLKPEALTSTSSRPIAMFSDWLMGDARHEINQVLPTFSVEVLSGQRSGRYPSIGIRVMGQQAWALGFDANYDFDMNSDLRPRKPPYCGWRGGSSVTGAGAEGRQRHRILKQIFPGAEWLAPDQWWSTYRELPFSGDESAILSGADYRRFVVETFVNTFEILLRAANRQNQMED